MSRWARRGWQQLLARDQQQHDETAAVARRGGESDCNAAGRPQRSECSLLIKRSSPAAHAEEDEGRQRVEGGDDR